MRRAPLFLLIALALGLGQPPLAADPPEGGPAGEAPDGALDQKAPNGAVNAMAPVDAEVGEVLARLMRGWAAGSGPQLAAAFSEEADFVPYFGIHVHGRDAIAKAHQPAFDAFLKGTKLHYEVESIRSLADGVVLVHTRGAVVPAGSDETSPKPTSIQTFVMVRRQGELVIESFQNTQIQALPGPPPR